MGLLDLFGVRSDSSKIETQVQTWIKTLRSDQRAIDREIRAIERQESKTVMELKTALKADRSSVAHILAKELVRSKHAKQQMYITKASLNSIALQLQSQLGMNKVAKHIRLGNEAMVQMNAAMNIGKVSEDIRSMAKEMMRAGIIQEMVEESINDGVEEEADEEVEKVIAEIAAGIESIPSVSHQQTRTVPIKSNIESDKFGSLKSVNC